MDDLIKQCWTSLWDATVQLHADLEEFECLFVEEQSRVLLMNKVSAGFFGRLQQILWANLLLQLCRLTDPVKSAGRCNLSLQYYLEATSAERSPEQQQICSYSVNEAKVACSFARKSRNARIAHRDFNHATGAEVCPPATLANVRSAVIAIRAAMDLLDLSDARTIWNINFYKAETLNLLRYLEQGWLSHLRRKEACRVGTLPWKDRWLIAKPDDFED